MTALDAKRKSGRETLHRRAEEEKRRRRAEKARRYGETLHWLQMGCNRLCDFFCVGQFEFRPITKIRDRLQPGGRRDVYLPSFRAVNDSTHPVLGLRALR
jgi:hypothetical protein